MAEDYEFSVDWFSLHWPNWLQVTADRNISKVLEIGSFEGRSACAMIEEFSKNGPLELHCIDNWSAGFENGGFDMELAERRFDRNVTRGIVIATNPVKVMKYKSDSSEQLASLLSSGHRASFDLIYVDGSHVACDVVSDLIFAYHLCAIGGLIICDDYLWTGTTHGSEDLLSMPRSAIDAFIGLFTRKVEQWGGLPLYQVYLRKTV
jgi:predicted O-methyltransferase YrrM